MLNILQHCIHSQNVESHFMYTINNILFKSLFHRQLLNEREREREGGRREGEREKEMTLGEV